MDKKLIFLLLGVFIIITGISLSLIIQPEIDNDESMDIDSEQSIIEPENQFKEVEVIFYNSDASISWNLQSNTINNYTEKNSLELSAVEIDAKRTNLNVDEDGKKSSSIENSSGDNQIIYKLKARESLYNIKTGEIEIKGPLNIQRGEINFFTGKLNWQDGNDILIGTGGIRIESPYFRILGDEMKADLALKNIVVEGKDKEQAFFSWEKRSESN